MPGRVRKFLESLALTPAIEGRAADVEHAAALAGHRSMIQRPDRATPNRLPGQWVAPWDGTTTPPSDVQQLLRRPPLLDQAPATGAHAAPFIGYDRLNPAGWDGETVWGAPNVVGG